MSDKVNGVGSCIPRAVDILFMRIKQKAFKWTDYFPPMFPCVLWLDDVASVNSDS